MVMVVVPALAQGKDCHDKVIATTVGRWKTPSSHQVREGIDRVRDVVKKDRRDEEAPHDELGTVRSQSGHARVQHLAEGIQSRREENGNHGCVPIDPAQLGEFEPVTYERRSQLVVSWCEEPSHVRPSEAVHVRRMDIARAVCESMVIAMMGCPP